MLSLPIKTSSGEPLSVLAIGAHPDDIEIGAGGLLLGLAESELRVRYVVLTGTAERQQEARDAAHSFLPGADLTIELFDLPEGRLPAVWGSVKEILEEVARSCSPDVIIAPSSDDAHQDHRTIGELVPTVFRDQLYLAYEIPKWDGDMSRPSMYVPLSSAPRSARWSCCTNASRRSEAVTGGTTRFSSAWRGCVAWNAGRGTPRRSGVQNR